MQWLNENAGIIVLVFGILTVALMALSVYLLIYLRNRIAIQRLSFLGLYSKALDTRQDYAELTIGNKTLNTISVAELGLKNGKVAFDLTSNYRMKAGLPEDAKIVIAQRSSIKFRLTSAELAKIAIRTPRGKLHVGAIRIYAVDITGTLYRGRVPMVRKLLKELAAFDKRGEAVPAARPEEGTYDRGYEQQAGYYDPAYGQNENGYADRNAQDGQENYAPAYGVEGSGDNTWTEDEDEIRR